MTTYFVPQPAQDGDFETSTGALLCSMLENPCEAVQLFAIRQIRRLGRTEPRALEALRQRASSEITASEVREAARKALEAIESGKNHHPNGGLLFQAVLRAPGIPHAEAQGF